MGRIHRLLLSEIARPFGAALLFLFQLLFAMQLLRGTDVLFGSSVSAADIFRIALWLTPHFVVMALPIAFLIGVLLGLGRLAEDRELLALSACGVSPLVLLPVPVGLGLALAAGALGLGWSIEPDGLLAVRVQAGSMLRKNLQGDIQAGVFFDDLSGLTLYAEKVEPGTTRWAHVLVHDDRDPRAPLLLLAQHGRLLAGDEGALGLQLEDGLVHRSAQVGSADYDLMHFERADLGVGLGDQLKRKNAFKPSRDELSLPELYAQAQASQERGLWLSLQRRLATPLAPLALALVAVPLGASLRKAARSQGFAAAAAAFALYYVLGRLGQQWGEKGALGPLLAAQLPNLLFAAAGLGLWLRARRRA
jgi:lipopolysaccharide export system permease protein